MPAYTQLASSYLPSHKSVFFTLCLTSPVVLVLSKCVVCRNLRFQQDLNTEAVSFFLSASLPTTWGTRDYMWVVWTPVIYLPNQRGSLLWDKYCCAIWVPPLYSRSAKRKDLEVKMDLGTPLPVAGRVTTIYFKPLKSQLPPNYCGHWVWVIFLLFCFCFLNHTCSCS